MRRQDSPRPRSPWVSDEWRSGLRSLRIHTTVDEQARTPPVEATSGVPLVGRNCLTCPMRTVLGNRSPACRPRAPLAQAVVMMPIMPSPSEGLSPAYCPPGLPAYGHKPWMVPRPATTAFRRPDVLRACSGANGAAVTAKVGWRRRVLACNPVKVSWQDHLTARSRRSGPLPSRSLSRSDGAEILIPQ